ncbi:LINE-1 reverse transcriptase homolog [Linum grandiflorum]
MDLKAIEESILRQKSRDLRLKLGDSNTAYFHASVKIRQLKNQIVQLEAHGGHMVSDMPSLSGIIVDYYSELLGKVDTHVHSDLGHLGSLLQRKLPHIQVVALCLPITAEEVKVALFSIPEDKSPGPYGFTSCFYKVMWDIVQDDVVAAILQFFETGIMPKVVNSTLISLIPKKANATHIRDFWPIACCNVLYKCVAKILARRLAACLPEVVSQMQSAFVKGRQIGDDILLAHELVNSYHLKHVSPRCAMKIDLRKAFDSVDHHFLFGVMRAMAFPETFVNWIESCLQSVMFSIGLNGGMVGYFSGKKGLRQGNPLSPALFVLVMEVLHCLFAQAAGAGLTAYYPRCKKLNITHICFADDLLVFSNGTLSGVQGVCEVLASFYCLSGLQLNPEKTEVFYSQTVPDGVRDQISVSTGFKQGCLPVRYLGVSLVSGRLTSKDCAVLTQRITRKKLELAGEHS